MSEVSHLFDSLLEPSFIIDQDMNILYCNETAAQFCNNSVRRLQRLKFNALFTFEKAPDWVSKISEVTTPTSYQELIVKVLNDEEDKKVQITAQKISAEGAPGQWLVYVRDVTLEYRLQKKYHSEAEQKEKYILELKDAQAKLEEYNRNLEKTIEQRTAEVRSLSRLQSALLDSLKEGFFVFDQTGTCLNVSSKACQSTIETSPNGKNLSEVLQVPADKLPMFNKWIETIFLEILPFEDLVLLGPSKFPHSKGNHIKLDYHPIRDEAGQISGIVVVASDITDIVRSQKEAREERAHANLIISVVKNKNEVSRALFEIQKLVTQYLAEVQSPVANWSMESMTRHLHTIKGGSATFNFNDLADVAHEAESELVDINKALEQEALVKVHNRAHELKKAFEQTKNGLVTIFGENYFAQGRRIEVSTESIIQLCKSLTSGLSPAQLAEKVEREFLMEPIGKQIKAYDLMTTELAIKLGKEIKSIEITNGELPVYTDYYSSLLNSLVHAFRNAVDHGIEMPEERIKKGKDTAGKIHVEFSMKEKNTLEIRILDDGNGIDPEKIRKKLKEKNIPFAGETDTEIIQHIFDSQFSTRDEVSAISGRGVGMDAIKDCAKSLGGTCFVQSVVGAGTKLIIQVPYYKPLSVAEKNEIAA